MTLRCKLSAGVACCMHFSGIPPTLTGIIDTDCSSINSSPNQLVGCPPGGGGTLTIQGTDFSGIVLINLGCSSALTINGAFTQITCTFAAGTAGTTSGNVVVTTNAGPTLATGYTIGYGNSGSLALHRSQWILLDGCLID